jgi:hypothetical protein
VTARDLLKRFAGLGELRKCAQEAHAGEELSRAELLSIDGVGPVVVEALGDFSTSPTISPYGTICSPKSPRRLMWLRPKQAPSRERPWYLPASWKP